MKNFLPLIIIILIALLFAILAFQTAKIIEGNTNMSSNDADATCVYGNWATTGSCIDGKIEQTQNLTSGGSSCSPSKTREINCQTSGGSNNLASGSINTNKCSRPSDLTGYEFTHENLSLNNFELGGLKCAADYYGTPTAEACSSVGTPYSLKGCTRITAEVKSDNPREIIVSFSKPISIEGSPEDLKNNFKCKIEGVDVEFKTPIKATISGNSQIKLITSREVPQDKAVMVKYQQNKVVNQGGVELSVDDVKLDMIDEISVVNSVVDTSGPELKIAHITDEAATTIIAVFNETLQHNPSLAASDFKVKVNEGIGRTPNKVVTSGNKLIVSLRQTIQKGQRIQLSYNKNTSDTSKQVKDIYDNALESLANVHVVNNVGYPNATLQTSDDNSTTDGDKPTETSKYTDKETEFYNSQYIKSMGAHNPFQFLNEKSGMNCKIDENNKNRAICDLNRNQPIQQLNVDDLKDNRGDEKDKYILKTKIVPVVYPRCPICNEKHDESEHLGDGESTDIVDAIKNNLSKALPRFKKVKLENNFSVGNPLELNKSVSKILDVQENLKLDKYDRSIKGKKDNSQLRLNPGIQMPDINKEFVEKAAGIANIIPPKFTDENNPTPLTHEISHVKETGRSTGFIPRLTSFSKF